MIHILQKKGVVVGLILVGVVILVELAGLGWLALSVGRYRQFWVKKAQQPGELTYLALGDSTAQGIGASSPMRGYVGLIAKRLEAKTGKRVRVVNLSVTGAKLQDYLRDQAPQIKDYHPDLVTIEIGANNVASYDEPTFRAEFKQVLDTLPAGTIVSNMPFFDTRPSSTKPAMTASKVVAEELSHYPDLTLADLQKQTTEHSSIFGYAPDFFHPNNLSYKNWAEAFWQQIDKNL